MKKSVKIFICGVVAIVGLNIHVSFQWGESPPATMSLMNIEALAQGESGNGRCKSYGCVDCPYSGDKVLYVE